MATYDELLNPIITFIASNEAKLASKVREVDTMATKEHILFSGLKYMAQKIPYLYGGEYDANHAMDCSSFMQKIFGENGIILPRTSIKQSSVGSEVTLANLQLGDLMFFDTDLNGVINHVGMHINGSYMIHTYKPGIDIVVEDFTKRSKQYVTSRRVF